MKQLWKLLAITASVAVGTTVATTSAFATSPNWQPPKKIGIMPTNNAGGSTINLKAKDFVVGAAYFKDVKAIGGGSGADHLGGLGVMTTAGLSADELKQNKAMVVTA